MSGQILMHIESLGFSLTHMFEVWLQIHINVALLHLNACLNFHTLAWYVVMFICMNFV